MGQISKGILGGFSGTVGTVVGGNWRGIDYMRSKAVRRTSYPATQAQLDQRSKFLLANRFIQTLPGLLDFTFKDYAVKMTARNSATSYLLKNAITGSSPSFELDYSQVLISMGKLAGALNAAAVGASGKVNFTWVSNASGKAKANDRAILVLHCPALKQSIYTTIGATRSTGSYSMEATAFSGQEVHTYIGFISEDGALVATSVYTGAIIVG